MKILFLDVESQRGIPDMDQRDDEELKVPGIEYAKHWGDYPSMGVAACCAQVYEDGAYQEPLIFFGKNLISHLPPDDGDLLEMIPSIEAADLIVTFGGIRFDIKLLDANSLRLPRYKHYDLSAEWKRWKAKAKKAGAQFPEKESSSLDTLCKANLGRGKSGEGSLAPVLWQQNRQLEVIRYCLNDCLLTGDLYLHAKTHAGLSAPCGQFVRMEIQ